jgi:hypothetical protein
METPKNMNQEIASLSNSKESNFSIAEQLEKLRFTVENLKQEREDYSDAQFQKLKLEIDSLEQKNRWENHIGKWIPVLTAIIAVGGFLFGIGTYIYSQRVAADERANAENTRNDTKLQKELDKQIQQSQAEKQVLRDERDKAEKRENEEKQRFQEDERSNKQITANQQIEADRLAFDQRSTTEQLIAQQQLATEQQTLEQQKSINQLRQELNLANEARVFDRRKLYLEKQTDLYFDAVQAASTIATSPFLEKRIEAEGKFWQLYFGQLAVVEDVSFADTTGINKTAVTSAMIEFGGCSDVLKLRDDDEKKSIKSFRDSTMGSFNRCNTSDLSQKALKLAHAIRTHMEEIASISK